MPPSSSNSTSPPTAIRPLSGFNRPATMLSTLVLPAPDGPNRAVSPGPARRVSVIVASPSRRLTSISAAGRALGMSYRRAWMLVDVMNRCWREPLVETLAGGSRGGGARVTALGGEVLGHYRALLDRVEAAAQGAPLGSLEAALLDVPR